LIVGIQPADDLAARHAKTFVQCVSLTGVWFDVRLQMRVLCEDGGSFVRRAVIEDDVLEILNALREHALDAPIQPRSLIP
jgi:hypothetical protein